MKLYGQCCTGVGVSDLLGSSSFITSEPTEAKGQVHLPEGAAAQLN